MPSRASSNNEAVTPPPQTLTPRALERRLKRYVRKEPHDFLAVGAPGFESVLLREVEALPNIGETRAIRGGVEFKGALDALYHANLHLATAHRVLWRVADFLAQSYPMLYNKARKIPWEHYLGFAETVRFTVSARGSRLHHGAHIAETLLSAVQDALEPLGLKPQLADDEATSSAAINIHVRLFRDRCTLSLDSSGDHLHRRGYRTQISDAPLRETLAAAILKEVGLEAFDLIVDPFCGSGTFLLEAARLLSHHPPGAERHFAFEHFPIFQDTVWERLKRDASESEQPFSTTLLGFDKDEKILRAVRHNAEAAGVAQSVHFAPADARTLPYQELLGRDKSEGKKALLVSNPPYGKRLASSTLHSDLSAALRASPGWHFALLTPERSWLELPVHSTKRFQNGGLEVFLLCGKT